MDTAYLNQDEIVLIERPASIDDLRKLKENKEKEKQAYVHCRDRIWARNLPMKLVSAHYLLDEPKILFYFTAESRVDFRELVKDLVSLFKMRIELRQIGVRDEARVTGGCGVCGRVLCCHGVSDRLNPVSIKMAKDQNLSLKLAQDIRPLRPPALLPQLRVPVLQGRAARAAPGRRQVHVRRRPLQGGGSERPLQHGQDGGRGRPGSWT